MVWDALIGLAGAGITAGGQAASAKASQAASKDQMEYQTVMSNTAYRRAVMDMRKAGINPMIAYKQGGASTPSGAMPSIPDFGKAGATAVEGFKAGNQKRLIRAQADELAQRTSTGGAMETKALADAQYAKASAMREMALTANAKEQGINLRLQQKAMGFDMHRREAEAELFKDPFWGPIMRGYQTIGLPGMMYQFMSKGKASAVDFYKALRAGEAKPSWSGMSDATMQPDYSLTPAPRGGFTKTRNTKQQYQRRSREQDTKRTGRYRNIDDLFN